MNERDQARFAKLISDFAESSGFEEPFHLVVLDARGSCSVTRYGPHGIEQVCSGPSQANRLHIDSTADGDMHQPGRRRQVGEDRDRGGGADNAVTAQDSPVNNRISLPIRRVATLHCVRVVNSMIRNERRASMANGIETLRGLQANGLV
ncbi:hypothetical protein [Bradyrhizobium sp. RDM4]|uniref:hypothetical protein n=1 Tax=Bradyrhizobium sp. RDM4 TaxID=3378765 RepID=UPI0038FCA026